ncbi:MAG: arylsulfatase A-like enzyme [Planctomycetota bacterium]|jgi:arylsulfatase A-like enzyme
MLSFSMNSFLRQPFQLFRSEGRLLLPALALLMVSATSCGDSQPAPEPAKSMSSATTTGPDSASNRAASAAGDADAASDSNEAPSDSGVVLEITRSTPLLPKTGTYDQDSIDRGLLPSGTGIWFSLSEDRQKRSVDRHIKGFELIAQSYASNFRDSRRSVVLRVVASENWKSPLLKVPTGGKLAFSYMPYLPGMGGFLFGLDWKVSFEVVGTGGRVSSAEIWTKRHLLRPPTGGDWRDTEIDLAELAGREGHFVFEAVPTPESPAVMPFDLVAAFANPTVRVATDKRPNIVVISIDTLRKDAISPYGADPQKTPNLQSLADKGVVFDQFWSTSPWTLPAYASLFTAEYPSTHGAGADRSKEHEAGQAQGTLGVATGIPSLVSEFQDLGYRTQSFYSNGHLNLNSGIERGFDGYTWYGMTGDTAAQGFHEWTGTTGDQPFFAFVQMTDPHWPYVVPRRFAKDLDMPDTRDNESLDGTPVTMFADGVPEEDREDMVKIYGFLVEYMDKHVGKVLKSLEKRDLLEDTLIIFHTDHGEELWDHGEWWHGHTHHAELENVSLMFTWPGKLEAGTRIGEPVRAIDVLPTALDLMGLPRSDRETEGRSFAHLLRGEDGPELPPILHEAELYGNGKDFALTMYPWRLLVQPVERWTNREARKEDPKADKGKIYVMLFNIEEDPKELNDVAAEFPERVAKMRQRAEGLKAVALERREGVSEPASMGADADASRNMSALGYTGD